MAVLTEQQPATLLGVNGCSGRKPVCSASVLFVGAGQGLVRFANNMPWI